MKNKKISILIPFLSFLSPFLSYTSYKNETPYIIGQKISPTAEHSLRYSFIKPWFSLTEIPVVVLETRYAPKKIIGTFQLPNKLLSEAEYPRFSPNKKYLLILNAPWNLVYKPNPEYYEWNLFDITQQKTIKTFPRNSNPIFMGNNNAIRLSNGTEIPLPEEESETSMIPEPRLTPWD